ncbi:hypothetical protein, partial [Klebsiella pneumoniae]|uniref:hypothetical protein n=1 Tax=Klebsiella pneumoniae TaxID=573 RepID=UPI001953D2FB
GSLCCFSFTPDRTLTIRDLGTLKVCADMISTVLERDRAVMLDRKDREKRIRSVIADSSITMLLQPIYRTEDRGLAGFEALARFADQAERSPD